MATAIVTAGAGARGAYEAGILSVVLPKLLDDGEKNIVLIGTSAGALNTAIMAGAGCSPPNVVKKLTDAWSTLDVDEVFTFSALSLLSTGIDFAFKKTLHDYGLFDTQPLRKTVETGGAVDWGTFDANFRANGLLRAAAVVATQAKTGASLVFVQGLSAGELPARNGPRGIEYVSALLRPAHVLASAAIPVVFPSVEVPGHGWFIDGGVRLNTPISPGVDLLAKVDPKGAASGSNRMIIVSTEPDPDAVSTERPVAESRPDIIDEGATLLYSLFVDRVAEDVLSLRRVNAMIGAGGTGVMPDPRGSSPSGSTFQVIEHCYFGPQSRGVISGAAGEAFRAYKEKSSHSLRGRARLDIISRALENSGPSHDEILSFILFDKGYLTELVRLGQERAKQLIEDGLPWKSYV